MNMSKKLNLTEDQKKRNNHNKHKAMQYFNLQKGYVLHHIDPTLRHNDIERYIEWRPEDLVVMELGEHSRLHNTGRAPFSKGKHLSEEHRKHISEAKKGHTVSEETRRKISEANKCRKLSEETKRNMSEAIKTLKWYTNGIKSIRLKPDDIIPEGFYPGRLYKRSCRCDTF